MSKAGRHQSKKCALPTLAPTQKMRRNNNPGVRQQGGRIYDSENGTTCHQCRQKTIEVKATCHNSKCSLSFCPRCLENRYNESVEEVSTLTHWSCPRCRNDCNCSNCRKKQGLEATGILATVAKTAGFRSVRALLQENPTAKSLHLIRKTATAGLGRKTLDSKKTISRCTVKSTAPAHKTSKHRRAAEPKLLDDTLLGPRPAPMPRGAPPALHKVATNLLTPASAQLPGSSKRQRGPAWLDKVSDGGVGGLQLPSDVQTGELACILEFAAVFGGSILFQRPPSLPALAAEITQPRTLRQTDLLCPVPEDSVVGAVHAKLLEIVRSAWGIQGPVGISMWQAIMCAYYASSLMSSEEARALREEHGPPALAGELFVRPPKPRAEDRDKEEEDMVVENDSSMTLETNFREISSCSEEENFYTTMILNSEEKGGVEAAPSMKQYPEGGYWGVSPGRRVAMLNMLIHDALETYTLRDAIEASMVGDAAKNDEKDRRSEMADVRRAAKEAVAKLRDCEIAMILAGGTKNKSTKGLMTLQQQHKVIEVARNKAEQAFLASNAAKVKYLSGPVHSPMVRTSPLGSDRDGNILFSLQCGPLLTGKARAVLLCSEGGEVTAHTDTASLAAAMDPRGLVEGPLRHALCALACRKKRKRN